MIIKDRGGGEDAMNKETKERENKPTNKKERKKERKIQMSEVCLKVERK
jgi:hypothetical protein